MSDEVWIACPRGTKITPEGRKHDHAHRATVIRHRSIMDSLVVNFLDNPHGIDDQPIRLFGRGADYRFDADRVFEDQDMTKMWSFGRGNQDA